VRRRIASSSDRKERGQMPTLGPGDSAPDFELPIGPGETFKLSTTLQEGPVVLLTYSFDFSPG
jgi:peroxiredoxin